MWIRRSDGKVKHGVNPSIRALSVLLTAAAASCDRAESADTLRSVSDSAGVEIVTLRSPVAYAGMEWQLSSDPSLEIGVVAGDESLELSEVAGALRLSDERIVVGNGGTSELRFYGTAGAHELSVGGDGEGPGEFRSIAFVGLMGHDTVVAYDGRLHRLSRFDGSGTFIGSQTIRGAILPYMAGVMRSGSWTDSWVRTYAGESAELEARWRHGFREIPPPERIPVFRSLEADTEGNVCAERYPLTVDAAPHYWCFTPEGRFLGSIRLPAGLVRRGPPHFDPQLEIGATHVLGIWADSLDVQRVRLYPLHRRPASEIE
jgi:hypothetical protein